MTIEKLKRMQTNALDLLVELRQIKDSFKYKVAEKLSRECLERTNWVVRINELDFRATLTVYDVCVESLHTETTRMCIDVNVACGDALVSEVTRIPTDEITDEIRENAEADCMYALVNEVCWIDRNMRWDDRVDITCVLFSIYPNHIVRLAHSMVFQLSHNKNVVVELESMLRAMLSLQQLSKSKEDHLIKGSDFISKRISHDVCTHFRCADTISAREKEVLHKMSYTGLLHFVYVYEAGVVMDREATKDVSVFKTNPNVEGYVRTNQAHFIYKQHLLRRKLS